MANRGNDRWKSMALGKSCRAGPICQAGARSHYAGRVAGRGVGARRRKRHGRSCRPGLLSRRALRPRGSTGSFHRNASSLSGAKPNAAGRLWTQIAAAFADEERTRQAFHGVLPRQEWFALVDNFERALAGAGLVDIHKEAGTDGAVIRQMIEPDAWDDFRRRIHEACRERFGGALQFVRDVHFGVGTKQ